jgi:hypothetical protein
MNRFMGCVAVALALAVAGTAQAKGSKGGFPPSSKGFHGGYKNYHQSYGVKFKHGYFYRGKYHRHWSHCYYDSRYRRYHYYDPCVSCYYYWEPTSSCYYPISYAAPVVETAATQVQTVNVQVGSLPVVPPPVPLPPGPAATQSQKVNVQTMPPGQ